MSELMDAVGQYVVYRAVIDEAGGQDIPLYLSVPEDAHEHVLSERIGQITRKYTRMKLLVFDPVNEEITQWID